MRPLRFLKYQYYKMLRVKDTPSKVAQGIGLGFAMDFAVPIPFVSIFISFVVAKLLNFNSLAAVMSATALKPFFPAILYLNFHLQAFIVMMFPKLGGVVIPHPEGATYIEQLVNGIISRGVPYLLAGLINGLVIYVISYLMVYYTLKKRIRRIKLNKLNKSLLKGHTE